LITTERKLFRKQPTRRQRKERRHTFGEEEVTELGWVFEEGGGE